MSFYLSSGKNFSDPAKDDIWRRLNPKIGFGVF
jgi:hypothetical protein